MMLSDMEQGSAFNAINFVFGPAQAANIAYYTNSTVLYTSMSMFICPSDGLSPTTGNLGNGPLVCDCNYVGSTGTTIEASNTACTNGVTYQQTTGIFGFDSCTAHNLTVYTMASVTDGTSNTIGFSEHLVGGRDVDLHRFAPCLGRRGASRRCGGSGCLERRHAGGGQCGRGLLDARRAKHG